MLSRQTEQVSSNRREVEELLVPLFSSEVAKERERLGLEFSSYRIHGIIVIGSENYNYGRYFMAVRFILTDYVSQALAHAVYDKLEDSTFAGRIPPCTGVVAFGTTLHECEAELRSTLEDWILVGLKLGHSLPVIGGIDLNKEPQREPVEAV